MGIIINDKVKIKDCILNVCNKGWKFFYGLFDIDILCVNFFIMIYFYKMIVFLFVFYGCELWSSLI